MTLTTATGVEFRSRRGTWGKGLQLSMISVEPKDNGRLLIKSNAIENSQTPALVAETLTLVVL